jgi:hypothetical protein
MRIEIEKISDDNLFKKTYGFYVNIEGFEERIYIDIYLEESRKTTRHKYKVDKFWERVGSRTRQNYFTDTEILSIFTEEIKKEAKEKIKQRIDDILIWI